MTYETPEFRKHALLPKRRPRAKAAPFIPAKGEWEICHLLGNLSPPERHALRAIIEEADLLLVDGKPFLLAPVSEATLDALAEFEASLEDLDPYMDDEDDGTLEDDRDSDWEPNGDEGDYSGYGVHDPQDEAIVAKARARVSRRRARYDGPAVVPVPLRGGSS